jgi:hypothetical protein
MSDTKFQKKLDKTPNPEFGDLNEYELSFITTPDKGPYQVEDMLLEALDLDFFSSDFINKSIKQFQKTIIKKIGKHKYLSIEECIAAYTKSATRKDDKLFMLKKSILMLDKIFLNSLDKRDKLLYLEKHSADLLNFDLAKGNFTIEDLETYRQEAIKINNTCLKKYVTHLKKIRPHNYPFNSFEDVSVFRGFNNLHYYRKKRNEISDFLSLYAGATHNESYYEPNILNSYTICHVVAERFMVANESQRRVFITTTYENIMNTILSSFLNSPVFVKNQFEILTIPNIKPLTITQEMNDPGSYASFRID